MATNIKTEDKYRKEDIKIRTPEAERYGSSSYRFTADPDLSDSQKMLLEAQKNAESAKATVNEAMTRIYRENHAARKKAESLARAFDEAIENVLIRTGRQPESTGDSANDEDDDSQASIQSALEITPKKGFLQRFLDHGDDSLDTVSEIAGSIFVNDSLDAEARREFYNLVTEQSTQLRQLIDIAAEDRTRENTGKIVDQAKSEIAAAQIAVSQSQKDLEEARKQAETAREEAVKAEDAAEEAMSIARSLVKEAQEVAEKAHADAEETVRLAREDIRHAHEEAMAEKQAAEAIAGQAEQDAMNRVAEDMESAKADVIKAREAADRAIKQSAEEIEKSREEIKAARDNAREVAAQAEEKVRAAEEEIEELKQRTQLDIEQATNEARQARENAEATLRAERETMTATVKESRRAKEAAEAAIKAAEEARAQAEENAYEHFREEMTRIAEEVEATKKHALDTISQARSESRQAKAEAEAARKNSEFAVRRAEEEAARAREEAERTRQSAMEEVDSVRRELNRVKEEAEKRVRKANEMMEKAARDIVSRTREEITRTREAIETAGRLPSPVAVSPAAAQEAPPQDTAPDADYFAKALESIREPVASMTGYARLMLAGDSETDAETRQQYLIGMVQQSDLLNGLIDNLTGKPAGETESPTSTDRKTVSPGELIKEVIRDMQNAALEKDILLGSTIPDTLPEIAADEGLVKEVLVNIVRNALQYNEGNSTVIVKTHVIEKKLMILVEDHGTGIPEDDIDSIFDEYYRAGNCGETEGQGKGLNICKQIVESYGGHIDVSSVEGEGSTFSFTLPLAKG